MPRKYSRRRPSSKKKSKKMRGGVTRKKLLTRRKVADLTREIGLGHGGSLNTRIKEFVRPALTDATIKRAVADYIQGGARKQRVVTKYGDISNWDTSSVTNMNHMFHYAESFNQPLNKWNVSKEVTNMRYTATTAGTVDCFCGACPAMSSKGDKQKKREPRSAL